MDKFHVRLKKSRERKKQKDSKWTQGYVAEIIGVARVTYTAYENGTKQPPLDTINKIADILGVSSDYLLGRTDDSFSIDSQEFLAFANDPELERWYRKLPESEEEDLKKLRQMWEIIRSDKKRGE